MTNADLDRIEKELGITLPVVYRESMRAFPLPTLVGNSKDELCDDAEALIQLNRGLQKGGGFVAAWPSHWIALAQDVDGCQTAIDLRDHEVRVWWVNRGKLAERGLRDPFPQWFESWIRRCCVPQHKSDLSKAQCATAAGYPFVAPILPELIKWLQDYNWPVAKVLAPFLASIGKPVLSEVRSILLTNDDLWKYWVLTAIVRHWPSDLVAELRSELVRLAKSPEASERSEELDVIARELLNQAGLEP